jgi:hypothetical protein
VATTVTWCNCHEGLTVRFSLTFWRQKYPDVEVIPEVVHASPGRVLAGASARADLVVLGRNSADDSGHPSTGAIVHALLSHAHSPVAIVPE